jgi:hypothetical protein
MANPPALLERDRIIPIIKPQKKKENRNKIVERKCADRCFKSAAGNLTLLMSSSMYTLKAKKSIINVSKSKREKINEKYAFVFDVRLERNFRYSLLLNNSEAQNKHNKLPKAKRIPAKLHIPANMPRKRDLPL